MLQPSQMRDLKPLSGKGKLKDANGKTRIAEIISQNVQNNQKCTPVKEPTLKSKGQKGNPPKRRFQIK